MALGAPALTLSYAPPISRNRVYAWNGGCDREPGDACLASRRGPAHEALPLHSSRIFSSTVGLPRPSRGRGSEQADRPRGERAACATTQ